MRIDRKLAVKLSLTLAACLAAAFLFSFLEPSRPLLDRMEARQAAADIRGRIENDTGPVDEEHPAFIAALSGGSHCIDELEKSLTKHEGWSSRPLEGAREVELACSALAGEHHFDVVVSHPGKEKKPVRFRLRRPIPDYRSLLPPIIAVIIAFGLREVRIALALGIWLGAVLYGGLDWTLGIWTMLRRYLLETVLDQFSFTIIVFTLSMVGMVRVAARAGGSRGIADAVSRIAASARTGKIATTILGLAVFFDDYSNTVVVGTTMRTLTDKFRVSREKLAYIVDSTSAPIAGIALVSTWIGYEIGLFQELSNSLELGLSGYGIFLEIVPLRFYCYFAILLVILTSVLGRDFGPMGKAERRAASTGELTAPGSKPMLPSFVTGVETASLVRPHWIAAAVPVAVIVFGTFAGMLIDGAGSRRASEWASAHGMLNLSFVRLCFESANGAFVLLVASLAGSWTAFLVAITRRVDPDRAASRESPGRRSWKQLLLPVPLSIITAAGISAIRQGGSIGAGPITGPAYWIALVSSPDYRFLYYLFLPFGAAATLILACRMARQGSGRIETAVPVDFIDASRAWLQGMRSLLYAVTILIMAWAIRKVCDDLGTSAFIAATLGELAKPWMIPSMVFVIACLTSFCTGTSWGTMGILIPTLLPFAFYVGGKEILMLSMGAVLDGAIFGDHCSPVSDTTVLSSTFSSCDHMDHIKTQVPYALLCAGAALAFGYLPLAAHLPLPVTYAAGIAVMVAVLLTLGRKIAISSG